VSKLQRSNDSEPIKKSEYIYCVRRKNQPRIHILVCERCRYNKKCANYQVFKKNIITDEYSDIKPRRKYKKRKIKK